MWYVSSKLRHVNFWKKLRDEGMSIVSSWIDGEKIEGSDKLGAMWVGYFNELELCEGLILYVEPGLILKGALIEVGAAMVLGKPVYVIWAGEPDELQEIVGTWIHHNNVKVVKDIGEVC